MTDERSKTRLSDELNDDNLLEDDFIDYGDDDYEGIDDLDNGNPYGPDIDFNYDGDNGYDDTYDSDNYVNANDSYDDNIDDDFIDYGDDDIDESGDNNIGESSDINDIHDESIDDYGVPVDIDESGLKDDNYNVISQNGTSFINSAGDIVVQERVDNGDNFVLKYIDIHNIAVVDRIRMSKNVDTLVQSIKSTGLLEPLVVAPLETKDVYVLIHGYRRIIACAKAGITLLPCVVNNKISTTDIPILEAMYNHTKQYTMKEVVAYIEYLEKEKGILSSTMIEYLLQMPSGDYTKLKDILSDDDEDIVSALMNEQMTISQAFKKLEQRRKKEGKEAQEIKKTAKVYGDSEESGVEQIAGSGEEGSVSEVLSEEEIEKLNISREDLKNAENESLDNMVEEGKSIEGFEPNKQDYKNREILDPALRKAVLVRDDNTCQCCGLHGQEYNDVFDIHHKVEVYLGGSDDINNLITVCTVCHRLIHSWGRGQLHIRPESELAAEEAIKFKKIVKLGNMIREGMALKGMKREELKKVDNAEKIGRTKPGTPKQQAS